MQGMMQLRISMARILLAAVIVLAGCVSNVNAQAEVLYAQFFTADPSGSCGLGTPGYFVPLTIASPDVCGQISYCGSMTSTRWCSSPSFGLKSTKDAGGALKTSLYFSFATTDGETCTAGAWSMPVSITPDAGKCASFPTIGANFDSPTALLITTGLKALGISLPTSVEVIAWTPSPAPKNPTPAIIGGVVGGIAALSLIAVAAVLYRRGTWPFASRKEPPFTTFAAPGVSPDTKNPMRV